MYKVYVLQDSRGRFYKGVTNNLQRRLHEHASGQTKSTKHLSNPKVVYQEEYDKFEDARRREVYLKSAAGRKFIKNKLRP